ncbi:MAG: hypothetical protein ACRD9R_02620 [Pyrinomonadaceae bacterium]
MNKAKGAITLAFMLVLTGIGAATGQAQNKNMLQLVRRLETHADSFSNSVDKAMDRTRLDGTRREDNINALVDAFEYETDQLRERIEDNEAIASDVEAVLSRAMRLEMFAQRNRLNANAQRDWALVREDLNELARMFNVAWVWTVPANAPMKNIPVRWVIRRIESRTDEFQNSLSPALDRSSLNGSPLEDEINALAQNLEKEADGLRDRANNRPGGGITGADVEALLNRALMVDLFMMKHGQQLDARTRNDWERVRAHLDELADAYNVKRVWTITVTPITTSTR